MKECRIVEKSKQESNNAFVPSATASALNANTKLFRYERRIVCLEGVISAIIFIPFVLSIAAESISICYLMSFVSVTIGLIYVIHKLKYSVRIDETSLVIQGFTKKIFLLDEILDVQLLWGRGNDQYALVKLVNGKVIEFSSALKDFSSLVEVLQRRQISEKLKYKPNVSSPDSDTALTPGRDVKRYDYPLPVLCWPFAVSAIFVLVLVSLFDTAKPESLIRCVLLAGFVTIVSFIYIVHLFEYSICIDETSVTVQGLTKKRFLLKDIWEVRLVRGKGGIWVVVKLANDERISFSQSIRDFPGLVEILQAHAR